MAEMDVNKISFEFKYMKLVDAHKAVCDKSGCSVETHCFRMAQLVFELRWRITELEIKLLEKEKEF